MKNSIIEGEDYYFNEAGFIVLTERYHLDRGYCCGNGCRHCPFEHINVPGAVKTQTNKPNEGLKEPIK